MVDESTYTNVLNAIPGIIAVGVMSHVAVKAIKGFPKPKKFKLTKMKGGLK